MTLKNTIFRDAAPRKVYRRFWSMYCLKLQDLLSYSAYSSALKMAAARSSYQVTRRHISNDSSPHSHRRENSISYSVFDLRFNRSQLTDTARASRKTIKYGHESRRNGNQKWLCCRGPAATYPIDRQSLAGVGSNTCVCV